MTGLVLVKLQDFTINSSEDFCDRVCNGICLWLQNAMDLSLETVQAVVGQLTDETIILTL